MHLLKRKAAVYLLTFVAAAIGSTGLASASVVTYTTNLGGGGTCLVSSGNGQTSVGSDCTQLQVSDYTWSITLPKFNGSLGTLNSVSIYFYENTDVVTLSATNSSGSNGTMYLVAAIKPGSPVTNSATIADQFSNDYMTLYDSATSANDGLNPATLGTCGSGQTPPGNCSGGVVVNNGSSTGNLGGYSLSNIDSLYTTDPNFTFSTGTGAAPSNAVSGLKKTDTTHLSSYTGTSGQTFTLGGSTTTFFSGSFTTGGGAGSLTYTKDIRTQLAAEVDYTYTPGPTATPEPATMGLMGSALIGLAVFGKRFRRQ